MRVICDSSILIPLARINQLHLLLEIFGDVFIPQSIYEEVVVRGAGKAGAKEVENARFIHVQELESPEDAEPYIDPLSPEDADVIVLAKEQDANLILSRDRRLRRRARQEGFNVASLMDFFILAQQNGFIPAVKPLLDELQSKSVLIREGVYQETLRQVGEAVDEEQSP